VRPGGQGGGTKGEKGQAKGQAQETEFDAGPPVLKASINTKTRGGKEIASGKGGREEPRLGGRGGPVWQEGKNGGLFAQPHLASTPASSRVETKKLQKKDRAGPGVGWGGGHSQSPKKKGDAPTPP